MIAPVTIADRRIGSGEPVYLIAEAGVNHNGQVDLALEMVDLAAEAGVDAVKFQIFDPAELASAAAHKPKYMEETAGPEGSQRDLLAGLALSTEAFATIQARCGERNVEFLASPFDVPSLRSLVGLGVRAIKLASTELTNEPLLCASGETGLPLLLSTGTCTLDEVKRGLASVERDRVVLLHCVSSYPTPEAEANLRAITTMAEAFGVPVGFSDHTTGLDTSCLAVAVGACVLEKHFTLRHDLPGPDHAFSMTPVELTEWVRRVRWAEQVLGDGRKEPRGCEQDVKRSARKSVVLACDVGERVELKADMLTTKRPGTGIEPRQLNDVVGRRTARAIPADTVLTWDMLTGNGSESS